MLNTAETDISQMGWGYPPNILANLGGSPFLGNTGDTQMRAVLKSLAVDVSV